MLWIGIGVAVVCIAVPFALYWYSNKLTRDINTACYKNSKIDYDKNFDAY